MAKSTIAGLTGLAIIFGLCSTSLGQEDPATQQSIENQDKPLLIETIPVKWSDFGGQCTEAQYVIHTREVWEELWPTLQAHHAHDLSKLPEIDFDTEMVIAAFMGSCNTGGYSIRVDQVLENTERLKVIVRKRTPPPWGLVTQAFTCPIHLVKLPRSDKPVCFEIGRQIHSPRSMHHLSDGPIDPNIYKELGYSPNGRAHVWILLKRDGIPEDITREKRKDMVENIIDSVLQALSADDFEVGYNFRRSLDFSGRITASGLDKVSKHPHFKSASLVGPFSLPEEFVIEQKCE